MGLLGEPRHLGKSAKPETRAGKVQTHEDSQKTTQQSNKIETDRSQRKEKDR